MSAVVLCLVEVDDDGVIEASRRALSVAGAFAKDSASPLEAVVVGSYPSAAVAALGDFGVVRAYEVMFDGLETYAPVAWARSLLQLASRVAARAVFAGGTDRGHEVLAYAGALSGRPMMANCLRAEPGDDLVRYSRLRWAGSLLEDGELSSDLALLGVAFDGVAVDVVLTPTTTSTERFEPLLDDADTLVRVSEWAPRQGGVDLAGARVVVGGGRGVGSAEQFATLDELAGLLGAAVGVSRVVTSNGWRSHAQQVGQTGTRIAPELYLAAGISGATQHLAGCQSAKVVIAVNTDADAPIITRADYAVIGDLHEVLPALIDALRAR